MKILFILDHMKQGGVGRFAANLSSGMVQAGHEVEIVTLLDMPTAYELNAGIRVTSIDMRSFRHIPALLTGLVRLTRHLRAAHCDLIISAKPIPGVFALASCLFTGRLRMLTVTIHEYYPGLMAESAAWKKPLLQLAYFSYRFAGRIVAASESSARALAPVLPQNRVSVIYNPVIMPGFPATHKAPNHPWLTVGDIPVLLAAGRMEAAKNFPLLLHAFAALRKTTACRLIILGEGEQRGLLEQLARSLGVHDDVSFAGFTDQPYAYMAKASVFVMSSRHEALPSVVIEALACGCRIVSTDCPGGIREIVKDGALGTLVPMDDPQKLAHALAKTLSTPDSAEEKAARRARGMEFSLARAVTGYVQKAS